MNVTVECSRCREKIEGIIDSGVTGGFYDVTEGSDWKLFADVGEEVLCDNCMHKDYRYRSVYTGEQIFDFFGEPMDLQRLVKMIDDNYTIRFYKHDNLYYVNIIDGGYYDRHQEDVAEGKGSTLDSAILNAYLQYLRWYDKKMRIGG